MISVDPGNFEGGACWARWNCNTFRACGRWPTTVTLADRRAVVETQVIIPRFTRRPADIITLAHQTGRILRDIELAGIKDTKLVKPSSWKGSSPKPKKAARWATYAIHRLVMKALSPQELAIYRAELEKFPDGEKHNLADAVGIGLNDLGRLKQTLSASGLTISGD